MTLTIIRHTRPTDWGAGVMLIAIILAWAIDAGIVTP